MKVQTESKLYSSDLGCRTAVAVSVVSDSAVFIMFITPDGEGTERNISERHNLS
jgi:hypothetical protein